MNIENLNKAIAIMQRAGNVNMRQWQSAGNIADNKKTEGEIHTCGTAACFAGWIAVSPEWKADGGTVGMFGAPVRHEASRDRAICNWLDIPLNLAVLFIGESDVANDSAPGKSEFFYTFYDVPFFEVKREHVIAKLISLRDLDKDAFIDAEIAKLTAGIKTALLRKNDETNTESFGDIVSCISYMDSKIAILNYIREHM